MGKYARTVALTVLGLMTFINLGRGCIHAFAPDGGAHSIAGLDLTQSRQTILSLFATIGLQQIVTGGFEFYVLVARRDLVSLALLVQLAQTLAGVFNFYLYRTLPVAVPGAPFNAALSAVVLIAVALSLYADKAAKA